MSKSNLKSSIWYSVMFSAIAVAITLTTTPALGQGLLGKYKRGYGGCLKQRKCCQRCPECNEEFCELSYVEEKESKSCFQVDYKTICIPKVKLPWQSCCTPRCAEARSVKVLVIHKYKCPKCKCRWEVSKPYAPACDTYGYEGVIDGGIHYSEPVPVEHAHPEESVPVIKPEQLNEVPVVPGSSVPVVPGSSQSSIQQPKQNYDAYYAPASSKRN